MNYQQPTNERPVPFDTLVEVELYDGIRVVALAGDFDDFTWSYDVKRYRVLAHNND